MALAIRDYQPGSDHDALIALALRAWAPVFASVETVIGDELATRLHGQDWRDHQAHAVENTLTGSANRTWVAEIEQKTAGFVVATIADRYRRLGEIVMLAVDPDATHRGAGRALTDVATAWLREAGMRVAMVETGGDDGHAPARRLYEQAGYQQLPIARYFKAL